MLAYSMHGGTFMCVCVHVVNVCVHCIHVYDVSMCVYCVSEICVVHVHCERVYKRGERNVTTEPRALPPTDHRISEGYPLLVIRLNILVGK